MVIDTAYTGFLDATWELNELQKLVNEHKDKYNNIIVSAPTSSGKSTLINMLGKKHIEQGNAILYIGIMKALAEEKIRDWSEKGHPWEKLNKSIVTGDYVFSEEKIDEIRKSQIIVMTPESLCSKIRNAKAKDALSHVGLLVADEIHLVGQSGRGGNLEGSIIEFLMEHKKVQFLGLSATIPNIEDFKKWIQSVTGTETIAIKSDYRPVELRYNFVPYSAGRSSTTENERKQKAISLVREKSDQQFLIFVFKKTFGYSILESLKSLGYSVEFHHAGKTKAERQSIESRFTQGDVRYLISTVTLATGVNLPARNVIVTSDYAGGEPIPVFEIQQAAGRAGRPKYDKEGDAYIFVMQDKDMESRMEEIKNGQYILSTLNDIKQLAAHFLGALYLKRFDCEPSFFEWYKHTLAFVQNQYTSDEVAKIITERIVEDMRKRGMIYKDAAGTLTLTNRGKITAQYLIDPYYAFQLISNFRRFFALNNPDDQDVACSLGAVDKFYAYIPVYELNKYPSKIKKLGNYARGAYVYYLRLRGQEVPSGLASTNFTVYDDIDRVMQAMVRYDNECEKWGKEEFLRNLCVRVKFCCSSKEADFKVRNLSKSDVRNLAQFGLQTFDEVMANPTLAKKVLSKKRQKELGL